MERCWKIVRNTWFHSFMLYHVISCHHVIAFINWGIATAVGLLLLCAAVGLAISLASCLAFCCSHSVQASIVLTSSHLDHRPFEATVSTIQKILLWGQRDRWANWGWHAMTWMTWMTCIVKLCVKNLGTLGGALQMLHDALGLMQMQSRPSD